MSASDSPKQVSPKVIAGSLLGTVVVAVAAAGAALTPQLFEGLGPWGIVVFVFVTALAINLAAWWKTDPLRLNTFTQATAIAQTMVRNGDVPEPAPAEDGQGRHEAEAPPEVTDPAVRNWPDNRG